MTEVREAITLEPDALEPGPRAASWLEPIPLAYRRRRGYVAIGIGGALALWLWYVQATSGVFGRPESAWSLACLAVGAWRYRVWMNRDTKRRFAGEVVALTPKQRWKKARPFVAIGTVAPLAIWVLQYSEDQLQEHWLTGLPFFAFALLGLFVYAFLRREYRLTPEAAELKRLHDIEVEKERGAWADQLGRLVWKPFIRYPLSAALLWFAYTEAQKPNVKWLGVAAIAFWGLVFAKEVALWLLGAIVVIGLGWAVFAGVAALPVSVAIILGALIIAGAVKK